MQRMGFHAENDLAHGTIKPPKETIPGKMRVNHHESVPLVLLRCASDLTLRPTKKAYFRVGIELVSFNFVLATEYLCLKTWF